MNQEMNFETPSFMMTYFAEPESTVNKILKVNQQIYDLLTKFSMPLYSKNIQKLLIIGVALSSETFPEKERLIFRKKLNKIEIRINMDYEKLLQATESETLQLIAQTYLSAISRFLSKRKDFDYQRFYEDVRKLFVEKGYLHEIEH